jgi:hypothetical protein
MLTSLASTASNITFINGQGTLKPQTSSWHNELHPSKPGFEEFADIFKDKLKVYSQTAWHKKIYGQQRRECARERGLARSWQPHDEDLAHQHPFV